MRTAFELGLLCAVLVLLVIGLTSCSVGTTKLGDPGVGVVEFSFFADPLATVGEGELDNRNEDVDMFGGHLDIDAPKFMKTFYEWLGCKLASKSCPLDPVVEVDPRKAMEPFYKE